MVSQVKQLDHHLL